MCRHYMTLYSCVVGMEAKSVMEFGAGFSTSVILEALEETDGNLISCDPRSLDNLEVKPHNRWHFIQAVSKIAFRSLKDEAFDLVFHDGSHDWRQVERDIKSIWPMVKDGGLILVHDTENPVKDYKLYKALGHIRKDKVTLPFGYGLTIIKKHGGKVKVNLKWRKGK